MAEFVSGIDQEERFVGDEFGAETAPRWNIDLLSDNTDVLEGSRPGDFAM